MRSRLLSRVTDTVTVSVEAPTGSYDGQGAPSYGTAQTINGTARYEDEVIFGADGVEEQVHLTLYVDGAEASVPERGYRVTVGGVAYIVRRRKRVETLRGGVSHVELKCRRESSG